MAPKQKRTRSRFGCNTCKKMKIKCDEQKPQCGNCRKSKKYFNQCDYTMKLSWGGRPYKSEKRKRAMENCGYSVKLPTKAPSKPIQFDFIDESPSIIQDYLVKDECPAMKRRRTDQDSESGGSDMFSCQSLSSKTSFSIGGGNDLNSKQENDPDSDIEDAFRYDPPMMTPVVEHIRFQELIPELAEPVVADFGNFAYEQPVAEICYYDNVKPGLRSLVSCVRSVTAKMLPKFSDATVDTIGSQLLLPSYKLQDVTAHQYLWKPNVAPIEESSENVWNLLEKKDSLMSIDNFFTQFNAQNLDFGDACTDQQLQIPFAESDDFWSGFSPAENSAPVAKTPQVSVKSPDIYNDSTPVGTILLNCKISTADDKYAAHDSSSSHYTFNRHVDIRIAVSLSPLPDLLRQVSYYRELFHFYVHCVADMIVNYKDAFHDSLCNALGTDQSLVAKNPFKYQLPAIAVVNEGILSIILAISASLKSFKSNFESLSIEDVGDLRKSSRTLASLNISKDSLSRYNGNKLVIQNLLSRTIGQLTKNLQANVDHKQSMIMVYLTTYFEKITCKKINWKLLDYEKDLVFTAFDTNFKEFASNESITQQDFGKGDIVLDSFVEYMAVWFSSISIFSGCLYKAPKVNAEAVYKDDIFKFNVFDDDDEEENDVTGDANVSRVGGTMFGLDISMFGEVFKLMQLSKEKCQLISRFRSSRAKPQEFSNIFSSNSGLITAALELKNKMISKMNKIVSDLDAKTDKPCSAIEMLKLTNKLYTYSSVLILYRRVIMVPRDSEIAQKFAKEILDLVFKLIDLNNEICASDDMVTMFSGCLSMAITCGALETLDFKLKKRILLKTFKLSKKNFNLNAFLAFEIIQESYENGMPLSEIVHKRQFMAYFS